MKYFNKGYANFIVDDEKEERLIKERNSRKNWRLDPELKAAYQKRFVKYGMIAALCWAVMALCYFAKVIYNYSRGDVIPAVTILYGILGILGCSLSVYYYREVKKARSDVAKREGSIRA